MESISHKKTTNNFIVLEVLNSRQLKIILKHPPKSITVDKQTKEIVSLDIDDDYVITTGATAVSFKITNKEMIYKIHGIYQIEANKFILYTHLKINKTTHFMIPLLDISKDNLYYNRYLINAYLADSIKKKEMWLLYRFFPNATYKLMEKYLMKTSKFSNTIDVDFNFTILVFNLTDDEYSQVNLFLEGQYSKFDPKLKTSILKFHNLDNNSATSDILYKRDKRRKQLEIEFDASINPEIELFDKPTIYKEIFIPYRDTNINISNYKILEI